MDSYSFTACNYLSLPVQEILDNILGLEAFLGLTNRPPPVPPIQHTSRPPFTLTKSTFSRTVSYSAV